VSHPNRGLLDEPLGLQTRSRTGGRAIGGEVVGRHRASEALRCGCCRCRVRRSEWIIEVLLEDVVIEVCETCAGTP
jgi:hypothetical protein